MKKLIALTLTVVLIATGLGAGIANASPGCADVVVTTSKTGPDPVNVNTEYSWTITITVTNNTGSTITGVRVQDGMGADLDGIAVSGTGWTSKGYYKKGNGIKGATMVWGYISSLANGASRTLTVTVTTGWNAKAIKSGSYQTRWKEFTSPDPAHELDGGASAEYTCGGLEYETLETLPLTVVVN